MTAGRPGGEPRSRPRAWPWPADSPLERSRRLTRGYRDALRLSDPEAASRLDAWAVDHGQGWVIEQPWDLNLDELWTLAEVAERTHVQVETVYRWHQRGLPYVDTPKGPRVLVADLIAFERNRRRIRSGTRKPPQLDA